MLSITKPFSVGPPPLTNMSCLFSPTLATLGRAFRIREISWPAPGALLISSLLKLTVLYWSKLFFEK